MDFRGRLHVYRFCDNVTILYVFYLCIPSDSGKPERNIQVWTFIVKDAELRVRATAEHHELRLRSNKLKLVCVDHRIIDG